MVGMARAALSSVVTGVALVIATILMAPGAGANTPACNDVVNDPALATCTCICEAGSRFPGCLNLQAGTAAPTPNQCPDMLQGRRVLSRGDALTVASPRFSGSASTVAISLA